MVMFATAAYCQQLVFHEIYGTKVDIDPVVEDVNSNCCGNRFESVVKIKVLLLGFFSPHICEPILLEGKLLMFCCLSNPVDSTGFLYWTKARSIGLQR